MLFTLVLTVVGILEFLLLRQDSKETRDAIAIAKQSADAATAGAQATAELVEASERSAYAAGQTAAAAARTARVAAESNAIAERTARVQLQAYVHADKTEMHYGSDGDPVFVFHILNTGQTPAVWFEIGGLAQIVPIGSGTVTSVPPASELRFTGWRALGAGSKLTATGMPAFLGDCKRGALKKDNTNSLSVRGIVRYGSIFGDTFESEFAFFANGTLAGMEIMSSAPGRTRVYVKVKPEGEEKS
jgi:hypothetical protein